MGGSRVQREGHILLCTICFYVFVGGEVLVVIGLLVPWPTSLSEGRRAEGTNEGYDYYCFDDRCCHYFFFNSCD